MRTLVLSAMLVALATTAFAGSNPNATFVLHVRPGLDGTCTTGGQPDCDAVRPTVTVLPNSTCQVYFYLNNVSAVSGVQTAFAWDASWTLLGNSWNCRSNQLSAVTPDPATHGGPAAGTIATVFDCVTSPGLLLIGHMYFMTGATGCLAQVQSSYPSGNHVLDCARGVDEFSPSTAPERFGSVCVGPGGHDACDPPSAENLPPEADAGGVLYGGQTSAPIAFDGSASTDPDGMIVAYSWDFGDGATGSGPMPTHTYNTPGEFQASLTVTDNQGATSSVGAEAVVVSEPATMDAALIAAMGEAGEDDLIPVIAACDEQIPSATLYEMTRGLSREQRRRTVLRALRSVVHTQDRALTYVRDQAQRDNATEPASMFIVNALATKAKASVVSTLASLQELDALYLDQRLVPMIDCLTQPDYSICQNTQNPCDGAPSTCADSPATCVKLGGEQIVLPVAPSGDPAHPSVSYALQFLGMPEVWNEFRLRGTGSLVLHMDAGIDYCQPSIAHRYSFNICESPIPDGYDDDSNGFPDDFFGVNNANVGNNDPYTIPPDPGARCELEWAGGGDHGTYTAGAAVGDGSVYPNYGSKITGAAPGAALRTWLGQMQSDNFRGHGYAIVIGADVVTVQYVNLTLYPSPLLLSQVRNLDAAGILTVVSIGDERSQPMADLAQVPEALAIGGIWNATPDPDSCTYMRYSHPGGRVAWPDGSTADKPDLVAPAVHIETVAGYWDCHRQICEGTVGHPRGSHAHQMHDGTSLAAPLVAGMAALLFERNNELLPAEIRATLEATALDLGDPGKDWDFGAGLPQIAAALRSIDLVNTFDRYLTTHSLQTGPIPTNWTFVNYDDSPPAVSVANLHEYDYCAPIPPPPEPPPPSPEGALTILAPLQVRAVGYVWDEREDYKLATRFRFNHDESGARSHGALLRWDPETRNCVYIWTRQTVPGDPTSTVFVFGSEEEGGGEIRTVPYSSHHVDFQDMTKDYYMRVEEEGNTVSVWVTKEGDGEREVMYQVPFATGLVAKYKGAFVADGAWIAYEDVAIRRKPPAIGVEETTLTPAAELSLMIATDPTGVMTFDVAKSPGAGVLVVYDVVGREVRRFDLPVAGGTHEIRWDGKAQRGHRVSCGVYFIRAAVGTGSVVHKCVIIR